MFHSPQKKYGKLIILQKDKIHLSHMIISSTTSLRKTEMNHDKKKQTNLHLKKTAKNHSQTLKTDRISLYLMYTI